MTDKTRGELKAMLTMLTSVHDRLKELVECEELNDMQSQVVWDLGAVKYDLQEIVAVEEVPTEESTV